MLKPIEGYDGKYFVSDDGTVFSIKRQGNCGKILSQHENSNGYLRVPLTNKNVHKQELVHRLVATAFIPNPDNLPQVNHKDGNKKNNNASNLEWCTKSENMAHASKNGLLNSKPLYGENHHACKISDDEAKEIIRLRKSGVLSHVIAKMFGVTGSTIRNIVYGRRKLKTGEIAK